MSEPTAARPGPRRKIAFFLPDMGGGGAERVQLEVMQRLVDRGHEVHLVLAFGGGVLLPLVPSEVRIFELHSPRLLSSTVGLRRYLRKEKPYSLQAIMWPCTVIAVVARLLARVKTKLILSEHAALSKHYPKGMARLLLHGTSTWSHRSADAVIAVSKGAARDLERLARLPNGRVEVIYNPINLPDELPQPDDDRSGWGKGDPKIISLGRFVEQKNHALLLRAFRRVLDRHPGATLRILAEGQLREKLELQAAELGIAERVEFPGYAVDPWPSLVTSDMFVLSSDYEGMGIVLVEAMHAGLRVVSTDCVAGPAELLDDGRYGTLVPVCDEVALAQAMISELAKPRDPERQRRRASDISRQANLDRYEALLAD